MSRSADQVRLLNESDLPLIDHLLRNSEYIYQRFAHEELPMLLKQYPALGVFRRNSLLSFLLSQMVNPPSAWLGGFGVVWAESNQYLKLLSQLLDQLVPHLVARRVRYLHYSGNDVEADWLRQALLNCGFVPYRFLYGYDKFDYNVPTQGNQQVRLRPVGTRDFPRLLELEEACFEDLWRYDTLSFTEIAATHPYFVVAELDGSIVGYQFNTVEGENGYLVRIAVHPSAGSKGIGSRLMAEAVRFFEREQVLRIMLNTQDDNTYAHRLYEWFGFERIEQLGFVLRKYLL